MVEYSNKIVFFIDILAFKDMVNKLPPLNICNMLDCIKDCSEHKYSYKSIDVDYSTRVITRFSDSICISFNYNDPKMLFDVLQNISEMQESCLELEIVLRGGCAIGQAVHNSEHLFGPAVNEAYKLESEVAIYPRIILSQEIVDICVDYSDLNIEQKKYSKEQIEKYLKKDMDGYYYIDYISLPTTENKSYDMAMWFVEKMQKNRDFIEKGLKNTDVKIKAKYGWLADKFDKSFSADIVDYYSKHFNIDLNHTEALFSL